MMKNNWKVRINHEGTLLIHARRKNNNVIDLFGQNQAEYGLCIYAHYLRPLRKLLNRLFPNVSIKNLEAIEEIIKDEFLRNRSVSALKTLLDEEEIPYRSYSNVA